MTDPYAQRSLCDEASDDDSDYERQNALETQQELDEAEREMIAELDAASDDRMEARAVDSQSLARESFANLDDLREWVYEVFLDDPDYVEKILITRYEDGAPVDSKRASELFDFEPAQTFLLPIKRCC